MNTGSFIVLAVVIAVVILDIRYLLKNGLKDCTGNCSGCGSACKWVGDVEKARKKIARQKKIRRFLHLDRQ